MEWELHLPGRLTIRVLTEVPLNRSEACLPPSTLPISTPSKESRFHPARLETAVIARPEPDEYPPFYETYISKVPQGNVIDTLRTQLHETARLLEVLTEAQAGHRYAPGKWSTREVLGHVTDAERIFSYRMLCIARGETTALPGFDEDSYARVSNVNSRPMRDVVLEYAHVRSATISLVEGLDEAAVARRGNANGKPISVRAIAFIIAGHERHHVGVIRDRYLSRA